MRYRLASPTKSNPIRSRIIQCPPGFFRTSSESIHWQTIWLVFAGYALFLAVIFFFGFKYNHDPEKIKHRAVAH
ncbi:TPA: hypothetical protein JLU46_003786 [Escherichia coli]|nr:hypothetical protein [Escherichia coli]